MCFARHLVVVLLFASFTSTARAAIPTSERDALIAIYNSTGGPSWSTSSNWLGGAGTECTWHGVSCDPTESSVVSLSLGDNNLTGPLPPDIGSLTSLEELFLSGNALSGPIPSAIGSLSSLRESIL